ncbi:hypothetical protein THAOC_22570 [Thalassiosira oceanica]|uniref:Uncharacterized protein n=1 Tax=Thalassiosira oceanica TaxID=159749 RepID=K0RY30_THAOC|nr:hypothetical protein THAOC_22570 [Thalassiosira oceanica]|eukprot:EJK57389.1 hypothetical protein THAOC_22570 [Thalassiosira oceanica]
MMMGRGQAVHPGRQPRERPDAEAVTTATTQYVAEYEPQSGEGQEERSEELMPALCVGPHRIIAWPSGERESESITPRV